MVRPKAHIYILTKWWKGKGDRGMSKGIGLEWQRHGVGIHGQVFDVGGQKAQRRKWIHIFDDVHAVLFITSLSEYNQVLAEDNKTNRMRDSIELFDQICNNQWFSSTAMILFLNKIDLFAEKIKKINITCALKNYKGAQEYRPALDYITKKFKQVNKNSKRSIYTHETCATDTTQIEVVIDSVIDVVIQQTMQKVGIQ
ncbi:g-protein alpha subunit [Oesophagostomum dentatum]|uniref:G-protein alpha subunit n=1 Tax=Oesophagostomum dentatum TaxID=61180 RepID=A0A0B1TP26_OESDE|nr:g-protein alpha subunit [Oesophagostomum dentatum]